MARDAKGRFSSSKGSGIKWDENTIVPNLNVFDSRVNSALYAATELHATQAEAQMRANAKWTDRTGNARSGLRGQAFHEVNRHGFDLFHSVPYGLWLEVRWGGRYAIIGPTLAHQGVECMMTVAALMRGMRFD